MNTRSRLVFTLLFLYCCDAIHGARQCGQIMSRPSPAKLMPKITAGYEVGYYKYPWFAAMQIDEDTICGGALIAHDIVVTAAHCFNEARGSDLEKFFMVKLGLYRQCKKEATQTTYKVAKVWIHEKYHSLDPYYDIALVKLAGNTSPYMPICLPPKILNDVDQEKEGWIIGFGSMIENNENSYPCEMHEGRILIYDNATCRAMVKRLGETQQYTRYLKALCAGYQSGGVDSCQGDSGGPLMTYDSLTNAWHQVGITAFGWGCGKKNQMGVYTDLSRYLDWIEEKTGVKPSDYQNTVSSTGNDQAENNPSQNENMVSSDALADTFIKIYNHLMNGPHPPAEITIRFRSKHPKHNKTAAAKVKPNAKASKAKQKPSIKTHSRTKSKPNNLET